MSTVNPSPLTEGAVLTAGESSKIAPPPVASAVCVKSLIADTYFFHEKVRTCQTLGKDIRTVAQSHETLREINEILIGVLDGIVPIVAEAYKAVGLNAAENTDYVTMTELVSVVRGQLGLAKGESS